MDQLRALLRRWTVFLFCVSWVWLLVGCGGDPMERTPEPAIPVPFQDEFLGSRAFAGLLTIMMLAGMGVAYWLGSLLERWRWRK